LGANNLWSAQSAPELSRSPIMASVSHFSAT
jgi:hypothetical protein